MSFTQYTKKIALVDCNSFYVSCETLFNPKLRNKPVVVLSNNDGCIISSFWRKSIRTENCDSWGCSLLQSIVAVCILITSCECCSTKFINKWFTDNILSLKRSFVLTQIHSEHLSLFLWIVRHKADARFI